MDQEKNDPQKQYDPVAEAKSKLLFAAIVICGMVIAKLVFGL